MRAAGTIVLTAILAGFFIQPASARTTPKLRAHHSHIAQRQIICSMTIRGCREVKKGCRVESMPSQIAPTGYLEVCDRSEAKGS
jgi:hypothetical protein